MRVLLCSDIHGNADALAAVLKEPADYVLCAGDLVHFGPHPAACIDLIRKRAALVVRGNHDHGAGFGEIAGHTVRGMPLMRGAAL